MRVMTLMNELLVEGHLSYLDAHAGLALDGDDSPGHGELLRKRSNIAAKIGKNGQLAGRGVYRLALGADPALDAFELSSEFPASSLEREHEWHCHSCKAPECSSLPLGDLGADLDQPPIALIGDAHALKADLSKLEILGLDPEGLQQIRELRAAGGVQLGDFLFGDGDKHGDTSLGKKQQHRCEK